MTTGASVADQRRGGRAGKGGRPGERGSADPPLRHRSSYGAGGASFGSWVTDRCFLRVPRGVRRPWWVGTTAELRIEVRNYFFPIAIRIIAIREPFLEIWPYTYHVFLYQKKHASCSGTRASDSTILSRSGELS